MFKPKRTLVQATKLNRLISLEPHVEYYDIESHEKAELVFPFQLMAFTLLAFVAFGLFNAMSRGESHMTLVVFWMYCIFCPFYFPGVYHFYQYFRRERKKSIEMDLKNHNLTYEDGYTGRKLHFNAESIESSVIYHSQMFPYGIDYLVLNLRGGERVIISSLLISPWKVMQCLELKYEVKKRVFNSFPPH